MAVQEKPAWTGPAKVRHLMTAHLATVGPEESLGFAMELMLWHAVRHLPVLENGNLVGVISDRDLLGESAARGHSDLRQRRVSEVMTRDVKTAQLDEDVTVAAARMVSGGFSSLPVVDEEGQLAGIMTSTDILAERARLFFKAGGQPVPAATGLMSGEVLSCRAESSVVDAIKLMSERGFRHLPVVDEGNRVVGMLSERDLRQAIGELKRYDKQDERTRVAKLEVGAVMSNAPRVVHDGASLFEIAHQILDGRVGAVPVVDDDDRLLGVISYVDVLHYLLGSSEPPGS